MMSIASFTREKMYSALPLEEMSFELGDNALRFRYTDYRRRSGPLVGLFSADKIEVELARENANKAFASANKPTSPLSNFSLDEQIAIVRSITSMNSQEFSERRIQLKWDPASSLPRLIGVTITFEGKEDI